MEFSPKEYLGCFYRNIPPGHGVRMAPNSADSVVLEPDPASNDKYTMNLDDIHHVCHQLPGKDVCIEHDESQVVGKVTRAYVDRDRRTGQYSAYVGLRLRADKDSVVSASIKGNELRGLSLSHDRGTRPPTALHMALCKTGARPDTWIVNASRKDVAVVSMHMTDDCDPEVTKVVYGTDEAEVVLSPAPMESRGEPAAPIDAVNASSGEAATMKVQLPDPRTQQLHADLKRDVYNPTADELARQRQQQASEGQDQVSRMKAMEEQIAMLNQRLASQAAAPSPAPAQQKKREREQPSDMTDEGDANEEEKVPAAEEESRKHMKDDPDSKDDYIEGLKSLKEFDEAKQKAMNLQQANWVKKQLVAVIEKRRAQYESELEYLQKREVPASITEHLTAAQVSAMAIREKRVESQSVGQRSADVRPRQSAPPPPAAAAAPVPVPAPRPPVQTPDVSGRVPDYITQSPAGQMANALMTNASGTVVSASRSIHDFEKRGMQIFTPEVAELSRDSTAAPIIPIPALTSRQMRESLGFMGKRAVVSASVVEARKDGFDQREAFADLVDTIAERVKAHGNRVQFETVLTDTDTRIRRKMTQVGAAMYDRSRREVFAKLFPPVVSEPAPEDPYAALPSSSSSRGY